MALIDLEKLVKGTKKITTVKSEALGGEIEVHQIPAQKMNSITSLARKNAVKSIAEQFDITPVELVSKMSENKDLRDEFDQEFRINLAINMVKEATSGTQTEITDEVIDNISQETLVELMNTIIEAIGVGADKEAEDDIKNS